MFRLIQSPGTNSNAKDQGAELSFDQGDLVFEYPAGFTVAHDAGRKQYYITDSDATIPATMTIDYFDDGENFFGWELYQDRLRANDIEEGALRPFRRLTTIGGRQALEEIEYTVRFTKDGEETYIDGVADGKFFDVLAAVRDADEVKVIRLLRVVHVTVGDKVVRIWLNFAEYDLEIAGVGEAIDTIEQLTKDTDLVAQTIAQR